MATYNVTYLNASIPAVDVQVSGGQDPAGNALVASTTTDVFAVDTRDAAVVSLTPSAATITDADVGSGTFTLTVVFSKTMNTATNPTISFPTSGKDPTASPATLTFSSGSWTDGVTYVATYDVADQNVATSNVNVRVSGAQDSLGNAAGRLDHGKRFQHRHGQPDRAQRDSEPGGRSWTPTRGPRRSA